ncbi:hypothetical protein BCR42DRAFT_425013 [Absidia repens]|uniref:Rhomboid-type serine protease n=1 Tax=Absidia repens TaxID=90262 RepID=A0A1X2I4R9_9FUNG|nr:hypothetical protein BCR42DRAFT_425013 [Absidia repens]
MRATQAMPPHERYICLNTTLSVMPDGVSPGDHSKFPPSTALELLHPIPSTANPAFLNASCSLQDICGMSGFSSTSEPDQSFRFFTPLFVHTGIIHYFINVFLHWLLVMDLERVMNPIRFAVVYLLSGLFGNVFGGSLSSTIHPSMGCNPSLFGLFGCSVIDIILMWRIIGQPSRHLIKIAVIIASSFLLGLLPGVNNLTQLGGLIGGLLVGAVTMPAVYYSKTYQIAIWFCRLITMSIYTVLVVILVRNFYQTDTSG